MQLTEGEAAAEAEEQRPKRRSPEAEAERVGGQTAQPAVGSASAVRLSCEAAFEFTREAVLSTRTVPVPVVVRIEGRWRSTENENGHRAVCTGCFRPHSHELVVPQLSQLCPTTFRLYPSPAQAPL